MSPPEVNKTHVYESNRKFQVSWVAKLPWVEFQVGSNGCVHRMKCKICLEVEHKNKLLALKWDSLQKHVSKTKVRSKKIEWYISKNCKHSKN
jgi:hypothetical protein